MNADIQNEGHLNELGLISSAPPMGSTVNPFAPNSGAINPRRPQ
jgi:hypothetical protein